MMVRTRLYVGLALICVALLPTSRARADYIPWSYSTTVMTTGPYAASNYPAAQGEFKYPDLVTLSNNFGNLYVSFAGLSGQGAGSVNWVNAFQMNGFGFGAELGQVGNFSASQNTFNLTVTLTDKASGASGSLLFHGGMGGTISMDGEDIHTNLTSTAVLHAQFTDPTQSLRLGNNLYTVRFPASSGTINGAPPVGMSVQVTAVPEPVSLALLGSGLAGLGLYGWRRRRGRSKEPAAV